MMKIKPLIYIILILFFGSCTKDRLIEIEPYVYPIEYWKKDSMVYTLFEGETILNQQSTIYGFSSPDTLALFYETQAFSLSFLEANKTGGNVSYNEGSFVFDMDSLFLLGSDTLSQRVVLKEDSLMVLETSIKSSNYLRRYRDYFHLLDLGVEESLVSFKNDIYEAIMYNNGEGKCMPCHNADGGQIHLVPSSLAYSVFTTGVSKSDGGVPYVNTLQAEESYLYRLVANQNVTYSMPPNSSLSPYEIETILKWIAQGAQDN
jgi:hypothetical protein